MERLPWVDFCEHTLTQSSRSLSTNGSFEVFRPNWNFDEGNVRVALCLSQKLENWRSNVDERRLLRLREVGWSFLDWPRTIAFASWLGTDVFDLGVGLKS